MAKFDYLIIQTCSDDVSNLNTEANNTYQYIENLKSEVVDSARSVFQTAENAIENNSSLKKVILMNHLPRFDTASSDPLQLKPSLSILFNNTINDLKTFSHLKERIFVGNHDIDCSGSNLNDIFCDPSTGRLDGVQLHGWRGRKVYTQSVINILKASRLISYQFVLPSYSQPSRSQLRKVTMPFPIRNSSRGWGN